MEEIPPPEGQINGGAGYLITASSDAVGSKRQRRPSVRLGDQPYDSHIRRTGKNWKLAMDHRRDLHVSRKSSKTRPVMNFSSGSSGREVEETLDGEEKEGNLDSIAIGGWITKDSKKRGLMSNWISSKLEEGGGEDFEDSYRDFNMDNSESAMKEQSPINSLEKIAGGGHGNEREMLHSNNNRVELSEPSDTDVRNWKSRGDRTGNREDGVRIWLSGLGLSRYAPVFEIHEVDDEVLPKLTLEDLKDMGISAVGCRRKMHYAIQRLGKGFS